MTLQEAYSTLSASPDHRVLRRVPGLPSWPDMYLPTDTEEDVRYGVIVDTETTGTGDSDEVIELAILPFSYMRSTGQIAGVNIAPRSGLRQPSIPIPAEATKVHRITDADVAGKTIDPAEVARALEGVHLVIAHKASFDRPMCEKLWPCFESMHWACSLDDIDWRSEGFSSRSLDYLLFRQGWFYDGHRALADATALLWLLTLPLPSGRPALAALLETARKPVWEVRAEDTPYECRDLLKARGYRWQPGADTGKPKAWVINTTDPVAEQAWLAGTFGCPTVRVNRVPPNRRFSGRV